MDEPPTAVAPPLAAGDPVEDAEAVMDPMPTPLAATTRDRRTRTRVGAMTGTSLLQPSTPSVADGFPVSEAVTLAW